MKIERPIVLVTGSGRGGTTLLASVLKATGKFTVHFQKCLWLFGAGLGIERDYNHLCNVSQRAWEQGKILALQVTAEDFITGARKHFRNYTPQRVIGVFNNLKVAYIFRSGMDVAVSRIKRDGKRVKIDPTATYEYMLRWALLWPFLDMIKQSHPTRALSFRNLVCDHQKEIGLLFDFLEKDWPFLKLDKAKITEYFNNAPIVNEGGAGGTEYRRKYRTIEKAKVFGTWKGLDKKVLEDLDRYLYWTEDLSIIKGRK